MNLLHETREKLKEFKLSEEDILCVVDGTHKCSWKKFIEQAKNVDYDNGFGIQEINPKLRILGYSLDKNEWWLERKEYDGSERWVYKKYPNYPFLLDDKYDLKIWSFEE